MLFSHKPGVLLASLPAMRIRPFTSSKKAGAVVPMPNTRRVAFRLEDSTAVSMTYIEYSAQKPDGQKTDLRLTTTQRDDVQYEMERVADFAADGMDVKPGKQPCVGVRSIDVAVVYSTGDTARFAVMGGARCDPTLYAPVWSLDSIARLAFDNARK